VRLQRDDGAIVYLNGTELFRDNLPEGVLTNSVRALSGQGGTDETLWRTFIVPASALREGRNVVAVQVHQAALDSSDIGFDVELTGIVHPPLQATWSVAQLILTTSPGFSNWTPESAGSLNGVWTAVTATPVLSGGQVRYTLPAPAVRQYYRMRRTGD
jgi:hypothetical protein